jgi:hypothetical protein
MTQKRHSASEARQHEIVEEVIDNLRPWKVRSSRAAVRASVKHELDILAKIVPLGTELFDRRKNRDHAQKLSLAIAEVERLLASTPGMLAWSLFNPLPPPAWTDDGNLEIPRTNKSVEEIKRDFFARANALSAELARIRGICAPAIDPGFGMHPNYDQAKNTCAGFAHGLMEGLSNREITGTQDGTFRTITSLLYEAVSGKHGVDLKRACDAVLRGLD